MFVCLCVYYGTESDRADTPHTAPISVSVDHWFFRLGFAATYHCTAETLPADVEIHPIALQ